MVGTGTGVTDTVGSGDGVSVTAAGIYWVERSMLTTAVVTAPGVGSGVGPGVDVVCTESARVADIYIRRVLRKSMYAPPYFRADNYIKPPD